MKKLIIALFGKRKVKPNKVVEFTPEILNDYNYGLFLIKAETDIYKRPDYAATVIYKLGYTILPKSKGIPKYGLSSAITDGWFNPVANNDEEMCEWLNNNKHGVKYRILKYEELEYILKHRSNIKQLFRNEEDINNSNHPA